MARRPNYDEDFERRALDHDTGTWWHENWERDGDPPTYDEVLGHLIRMQNLRLYALDEQVKNGYGYDEGDEQCPFFSERYLYPLMGKEDARTVLAMLKTTFKMLEALTGKKFPLRALY